MLMCKCIASSTIASPLIRTTSSILLSIESLELHYDTLFDGVPCLDDSCFEGFCFYTGILNPIFAKPLVLGFPKGFRWDSGPGILMASRYTTLNVCSATT